MVSPVKQEIKLKKKNDECRLTIKPCPENNNK